MPCKYCHPSKEPAPLPKDDVTPLTDQLHQFLCSTKKPQTLEDLSTRFDVGVGRIKTAIADLAKAGFNAEIAEGRVELGRVLPENRKPTVIDVSKFKGIHHKFGVTADNHVGSKFFRADVCNALFDIWAADGVTKVYQLGNMLEGERHSKFELTAHGLQGQVDLFIKEWPKRDGIVTEFITGDDHEGWYVQDTGVNIGKFIEMQAKEQGRNDLVYLGHMEHDIILKAKHGSAKLRLVHAGGGTGYAVSYSIQKLVESYSGGEKPNILLVGHYHKMNYGVFREIHCLQAGCTKDQDSFMRKLKLQAHVGGWTVEFDQDDIGNIHNFKVQWHQFFDKAFYDKPWEYKW